MKTDAELAGPDLQRAPLRTQLSQRALEMLLQEVNTEAFATSHERAGRADPDFDPVAINTMIKEARSAGVRPAALILGQRECWAYRRFLRRNYDEPAAHKLGSRYFYGLRVIVSADTSALALEEEPSRGSRRVRIDRAA